MVLQTYERGLLDDESAIGSVGQRTACPSTELIIHIVKRGGLPDEGFNLHVLNCTNSGCGLACRDFIVAVKKPKVGSASTRVRMSVSGSA